MGVVVGGTINNLNLGISPRLYIYTSSTTWSKPTASNFYGAYVLCVGPGGGGGSGRCGAIASLRNGGGGGGGGGGVYRFIPAGQLNSTHSITISTGGAGGISQSTISTDGNPGSVGGSTIFELLVTANGGAGGGGGNALSSVGAGLGGDATTCIPNKSPCARSGAQGGIVTTTAPSSRSGSAGLLFFPGTFGAGGGAGCRYTATNVVSSRGGSGGFLFAPSSSAATSSNQLGIPTFILAGGFGSTITGSAGGNGQNYTTALSPLLYFVTPNTIPLGTGGGGGGPGDLGSGSFTGGKGGNGGFGAGGGGGGGTTNGTLSGAGGDGGSGLCAVLELYGYAPP